MEVLVEVLGPGLPRQPATGAGGGRGAAFGRPAADLHLPELRVRDERPVDEHARSHAGPQRQEDHGPGPARPHAEAHLRDAGRVGVIDDLDPPLDRLRQLVGDRIVDPAGVDVRGGLERSLDGDTRQPDADRRLVGDPRFLDESPDESTDRGAHPIRRRRLGRGDTEPLGDHLAAHGVDDRGLDPAAADVDADGESPGRVAVGRRALGRFVGHRRPQK